MDKYTLRKTFLTLRNSFSRKTLVQKSNKISKKLIHSKTFLTANILHIYLSKDSEVVTKKIIQKAFSLKKRIFVPVFYKDRNKIRSIEIQPNTKFKFGKYNILKPANKSIFKIETRKNIFNLILVPLLAFDKNKHRLGYGSGFYDRLLKRNLATKIGLAFNFQKTENLPKSKHDQRLNKIISN